ncbi:MULTISPECIES: DUF397 domain-containing protein [Streptomyces]|uniref:DUF397 domain-containing protein n=1 Tax=Streptomyces TaxID=1883 RepID=UPI00345B5410
MHTFLELAAAKWRKSTYSQMGNDCLEVADSFFPVIVPVRDSKSPDGPVLALSPAAWSAFVGAVRGESFPAG